MIAAGRGAPPQRQLHGRRRGRRLRPGRDALVAEFLPKVQVALPPEGPLDPRMLFDRPVADVWLEVGFGGGEHLAEQARKHPEIGFIGCEPFVNGVASLLSVLAAEDMANVRIHPDDARPLIDLVADASIGRLFLLFPDPWPKARHHKRRFVVPETIDACARVLRDGAEFRLATDHPEYCRWMLEHLHRRADFVWLARTSRDWRQRPDDWPETRYEAKTRAQGARPVFLRFRRVSRR